jgi:hypothetical protein
VEVLDAQQWRPRAQAHRERLLTWVGPHLERRRRGEKHPVLDFLFTYYSEPPNRLLRWHPGAGIALADADERRAWRFHAPVTGGVAVDVSAYLAARSDTVRWTADLLSATASRPGQFSCFGLHEWAMVYRADEQRHPVPLRLGAAGTDAVVEAAQLRCTHHDAFRFFTPAAVARTQLRPTREQQVELEQPGCLHAAMDLYKWAYKLGPVVPGELLADCFALAVEVRELDMRASPYDLLSAGYTPVPVETAEGRAAYATAQRTFADHAAVLRARLLEVCDGLLA